MPNTDNDAKQNLHIRQFSQDLDFTIQDPENIYLIATTPRCGSHFLGHILSDTQLLGRPYEYLNPSNLNKWKKKYEMDDPSQVLAAILRRRTSPNGVFGLKAHWNHFAQATRNFETRMTQPNKIIWIYRRDLLGQAISFEVARQTGKWISGMPAKKSPVFSFKGILKCAEIVQKQNSNWLQFLQKFDHPRYIIAYEDLATDIAQEVGEIFNFITTKTLAPTKLILPATQKQSNNLNANWRDRFTEEAGANPDYQYIFDTQHF